MRGPCRRRWIRVPAQAAMSTRAVAWADERKSGSPAGRPSRWARAGTGRRTRKPLASSPRHNSTMKRKAP